MGIQINGNTDTISAIDGGLTVSGASLGSASASSLNISGIVTASGFSGNVTGNVNATGLSTFSGGLLVGTGASISSPSSNVLTLGTNNTESVRLDSSGRLGIGTNNPNSSAGLDILKGEICARGIRALANKPISGVWLGKAISGNAVIEIVGDTGTTAEIDFSVPSTDMKGRVAYDLTSDYMYFSTNSVEKLRIDSSGRVTTPYQPLAVVGKTNGTSSVGTIVFEKVWHNVGSHYDNSTGVFTCPVAGYYYTHIMVMSSNSDTTMDIGLQVNGSGTHQLVPYQAGTGGAYNQVSGSTIIYCAANDNLRYHLNSGSVYGGGGSAGRHSSVIFHLVG